MEVDSELVDTIELIDMCVLEKSDERFIRNVSVKPEKIVSLINDRQLSDIKRFSFNFNTWRRSNI